MEGATSVPTWRVRDAGGGPGILGACRGHGVEQSTNHLGKGHRQRGARFADQGFVSACTRTEALDQSVAVSMRRLSAAT
jgi:hypothetical protein